MSQVKSVLLSRAFSRFTDRVRDLLKHENRLPSKEGHTCQLLNSMNQPMLSVGKDGLGLRIVVLGYDGTVPPHRNVSLHS